MGPCNSISFILYVLNIGLFSNKLELIQWKDTGPLLWTLVDQARAFTMIGWFLNVTKLLTHDMDIWPMQHTPATQLIDNYQIIVIAWSTYAQKNGQGRPVSCHCTVCI